MTWDHLWCSQAVNHRFFKIYYLWKYYSKVTQNYLIICFLLQYFFCRVFLSVTEISKQLSFIFTPWLISHIIKTPYYILSPLYTLYSIVPLPPTFAYSASPKASPYSPFIPHTPMYFNNAETWWTHLAPSGFVFFYSFNQFTWYQKNPNCKTS